MRPPLAPPPPGSFQQGRDYCRDYHEGQSKWDGRDAFGARNQPTQLSRADHIQEDVEGEKPYTIDPYQCLGLPRGCTDKRAVESAFREKSALPHPERTNGLTRREFATLQRWYETVQRNMEEATRRQKSSKAQNPPKGQNSSTARKSGRDEETARPKKLDFSCQLRLDNDIIGDNFEEERSYQRMLAQRPNSLETINLSVPQIENAFAGQKFSLEKFNEPFEKKQREACNNQVEQQISGFEFSRGGGGGVRTAEEDDMEHTLAAECRDQVMLGRDQVTENDLEALMQAQADAISSSSAAAEQCSNREFKRRMEGMQAEFETRLHAQAARNQAVVARHIGQLSEETRQKLSSEVPMGDHLNAFCKEFGGM
ncbi:hypothetical protein HDV00_008595 [Rhizophlyctis rosea]|nr:hypothetical protein HDV00_008595 [Rhizophlyctis rosea]